MARHWHGYGYYSISSVCFTSKVLYLGKHRNSSNWLLAWGSRQNLLEFRILFCVTDHFRSQNLTRPRSRRVPSPLKSHLSCSSGSLSTGDLALCGSRGLAFQRHPGLNDATRNPPSRHHHESLKMNSAFLHGSVGAGQTCLNSASNGFFYPRGPTHQSKTCSPL